MTWLWIIIVVAIIGAIIGFIAEGDGEGAIGGALTAASGCGYVILQIFIAVAGIAILFGLFSLLFGGCN